MSYWWTTTTRPDWHKRTDRMNVEIEWMQSLFNTKQVSYIEKTEWDVPFFVETRSLKINIDSPSTPYWIPEFKFIPVNAKKMAKIPGYDPHVAKPNYHRAATYKLQIMYPIGYPASEPIVTVLSNNVEYHKHILGDNVLCLWQHWGSNRNGWDGSRHTAATFGLWAIQWLRANACYEENGFWPGD